MKKPKKISVADIKKALKQAAEEMKIREEEKRLPPKVEDGVCVVCQGKITGNYTQECIGDPNNIPIGPGSQDYYHWAFQGYHCTNCGLKYEFLPSKYILPMWDREERNNE
jgi:hypothetical protein